MKAIDGKIYLARNKENGKCYVGQTTQTLAMRINSHTTKASRCYAFHSALVKYGRDAFEWTVIDTSDNMDDLNILEVLYIEHYNSLSPNGYNLRTGGESSIPSDESKEKMRKSHLGKKLSPATIDKMRQSMIGKNRRPMTNETKDKLRQAKVGKKQTPEHIEKVRKAKGETTDDTKEKMRQSAIAAWAKRKAERAEITN